MRRVLALGGLTHAEALDRVSQDDGRCPLVFGGRLVGGVDLDRIVSAATQVTNLIVTQMLNELQQIGMPTEEVVANVGPRLDAVLLELTVHDLAERLDENARLVGIEQRLPVAAPHNLDDVPTGSTEDPFEFLNDLAVATHGSVEPLQIAVHNPREVVQFFARGHRDWSERLRLINLAIAEERPDARLRGIDQAAMLKVAQEPRVIDRADRTKTHRHGRELPEIGHQPRMRV